MKRLFLLFLIIIFIFFGCSNTKLSKNNNTIVHFIDVGQGDAILIQGPTYNLLIDAGPKEEKDKLFNYLTLNNIEKIHYLIATHPHEDHIGNMAEIIRKYNIEEFYAPKVIHDTPSFEKMVEALVLKGKKINVLNTNTTLPALGDGVVLEVFSPSESYYDNINNFSPIIKLSYFNNSFIFTGDAEKEIEESFLAKSSNIDLKADVLKIGHHGSSTSTSNNFLKSINPSLAIISVGANNPYGHPKSGTLELLKKNNIQVLRTDEIGSIALTSDGNNISLLK